MKKSLFFLTCLILVLALAGCAGGPSHIPFYTPPNTPWQNGETLVYSVERYRVVTAGGVETVTVLGTGTQRVTVTEQGGNFVITTDWRLTCEESGVEDTILTEAVVIGATFAPVSSRREARIRHKSGGEGYTAGDINTARSHIITADYTALTTYYTPYGGTPERRNIPTGSAFDNESLFYVVRALRGLGGAQPVTFSLRNMFDFHRNNISAHSISVSGGATPVQRRVELDNLQHFVNADGAPANNGDMIYTRAVRIALAGSNPGPPITAWFTEHEYTDGTNTARRLLVEYMTYTVDFPNLNSQTRIRYKLQEISWA